MYTYTYVYVYIYIYYRYVHTYIHIQVVLRSRRAAIPGTRDPRLEALRLEPMRSDRVIYIYIYIYIYT